VPHKQTNNKQQTNNTKKEKRHFARHIHLRSIMEMYASLSFSSLLSFVVLRVFLCVCLFTLISVEGLHLRLLSWCVVTTQYAKIIPDCHCRVISPDVQYTPIGQRTNGLNEGQSLSISFRSEWMPQSIPVCMTDISLLPAATIFMGILDKQCPFMYRSQYREKNEMLRYDLLFVDLCLSLINVGN
jgi:hypothetical protein